MRSAEDRVAPSGSTRVCIVRHGETDWNAQRRVQGQLDIPLNAAGIAQAAATAARLAAQRFDAVYSSDLVRAWQTAQPIAAALGLPLRPAEGLRERHYGRMQGLTADEARQHVPALHAAHSARDPEHDLEGGETLTAFCARVGRTLAALAAAHAGHAVLIVSHGGVLDIVYRLASGRDLVAPRDFPIPNAGLNWLEYRESGWRLVSWAETAFAETALDEDGR